MARGFSINHEFGRINILALGKYRPEKSSK